MGKTQKDFEKLGGAESLMRFTRDHIYVEEHWAELITQYPDQWIAVYDGEVIAVANDIPTLIASIPEEQRGSIVVKFMDTDPRTLILVAA